VSRFPRTLAVLSIAASVVACCAAMALGSRVAEWLGMGLGWQWLAGVLTMALGWLVWAVVADVRGLL
jgi:hypothetical protein